MAGPERERIPQVRQALTDAGLGEVEVVGDGCVVDRRAEPLPQALQQRRRLHLRPVGAPKRVALDHVQQTAEKVRRHFALAQVAGQRQWKSAHLQVGVPGGHQAIQPGHQRLRCFHKPRRREVGDAQRA